MSRLICCNLFLFQIATTLLQKAFQQIKVLFDKFFLRIRSMGWAKTYLKLIGLQKKVFNHGDKYPFQRHALIQCPEAQIVYLSVTWCGLFYDESLLSFED